MLPSCFRILFLILLLQGFAATAQYSKRSQDWPAYAGEGTVGQSLYNRTQVLYGTIFLKNKDTLQGRMKILSYKGGSYFFIELLPTGLNGFWDIRRIDRKRIDYIRAYIDPTLSDSLSMEFVNLNDKDLWRVLAKKEDIYIYDNFYPGRPHSALGEEMILVGEDKRWIRIFNHINYGENVIPALLNFINKRYRIHFQQSDFKDEWAMIHYILDKETSQSPKPAPLIKA